MIGRFRTVAIVVAGALIVAACAGPSQTGYSYTDTEARRPMRVDMGVIQSIRQVRLEPRQQSGAGTAAGAVVGGVAGSNIGGGKGQILGSVLGALAGGVAGSHAEQGLSTRPALELTVRTDSGRTFAVVQEAGGEQFIPGQRVRVLTDPSGATRISQ